MAYWWLWFCLIVLFCFLGCHAGEFPKDNGLGVSVTEDTVEATVLRVYCRILFDQWSFLLLVVVLGKMGRGFSVALGTQVEFLFLK